MIYINVKIRIIRSICRPIRSSLSAKLATGEILLNRTGRARITLLVVLVVGGIGLSILVHYLLGAVVVVTAVFTLRRIAKQIREIEEGMIEYRGVKASLSSKDEA